MKRSYLIQRLLKPLEGSQIENVFGVGFGGGLKYGGFTQQQYRMIVQNLCQFDYMGAAEFEHGAVADAFKAMVDLAKINEFVCRELLIDPKDVKLKYDYEKKDPRDTALLLHVICPPSMADVILERVKALAEIEDEFHVCERPGIGRAAKYGVEDVVGWLEMDNEFVVTVDLAMRDNFMKLLG